MCVCYPRRSRCFYKHIQCIKPSSGSNWINRGGSERHRTVLKGSRCVRFEIYNFRMWDLRYFSMSV